MAVNPADGVVYGGLFASDDIRAVFDEAAWVRQLLVVEAALARAQAGLALIPEAAALAIGRAVDTIDIELPKMAAATAVTGFPIVFLVRELARQAGPEAGRYVHWGATTQDIMDTALVLQVRAALDLVDADLRAMVRALAHQARRYRETPMAGRTHLQHALPTSFGYKCAMWLQPLIDHMDRIADLRRRLLCVQFGGAVGTSASLGSDGPAVARALADQLDLLDPAVPWHNRRDSLAELASVLTMICGSVAKMAGDLVLLAQTDVAEVHEPHAPGRGGSSTMPHKRNPIACEYVLGATANAQALLPVLFRAQIHDHERATGPWQSEWLALPQIFLLTSGVLKHGVFLANGMVVDADRMRRNLDATRGLLMSEAVMMALAEKIGHGAAHDLLEQAAEAAIDRQDDLSSVLGRMAEVTTHLSQDRLDRLLDPVNYLGAAGDLVDRVVAAADTLPEIDEA